MSVRMEELSPADALRRRSVACLVAAALLTAAPAGAKDKEPLKAGDVPPDSLGTANTGEKVKLTDYRGKVVVVTFWASWCPPCRKELTTMAGIQKQATTNQLQVLAVNWGEDRQRYRQILYALKPVLQDAPMKLISDEYKSFGSQYGVKAIPHMVIIGRDGKIALVQEGYGEGEIPWLAARLNKLLAESSEAPTP